MQRSERVEGRARPPEGRRPDRTLCCGRMGEQVRAGEGRAEGLRWPGGRDTHPNVHWGVQGRGSPAMSVTWYGVVALSSENPCGLEGTGPGGQWAGRRGHATVVQCSGKPRVRTRAAVPGGSRCDPVSRRVLTRRHGVLNGGCNPDSKNAAPRLPLGKRPGWGRAPRRRGLTWSSRG